MDSVKWRVRRVVRKVRRSLECGVKSSECEVPSETCRDRNVMCAVYLGECMGGQREAESVTCSAQSVKRSSVWSKEFSV